nr:hypothetical protein CFP56_39019 [Quercus suber]
MVTLFRRRNFTGRDPIFPRLWDASDDQLHQKFCCRGCDGACNLSNLPIVKAYLAIPGWDFFRGLLSSLSSELAESYHVFCVQCADTPTSAMCNMSMLKSWMTTWYYSVSIIAIHFSGIPASTSVIALVAGKGAPLKPSISNDTFSTVLCHVV